MKVGDTVWLQPNPLYEDKYPEGYFETEITYLGRTKFKVRDPNRSSYVSYNVVSLKENEGGSRYKGIVFLEKPNPKKTPHEQMIIEIRKHFNSRNIYEEPVENLEKIMEILGLK